LFPVYEVFDGVRYRISIEPDGTDPTEYFRRQRRFANDEIDIDEIRRFCAERMRRLSVLAQQFN
jgi:hypothetical protein